MNWDVMLEDDVVGFLRERVRSVAAQCESPIERTLLLALLRQFGVAPVVETLRTDDGEKVKAGVVPYNGIVPDQRLLGATYWRGADRARVEVVPQLRVKVGERPGRPASPEFRLDIAVLLFPKRKKTGLRIAVECDGHEFHDRTREQASRDRARDRALQSDGWIVARFTGSDIARDPTRCADEVIRLISETPKGAP